MKNIIKSLCFSIVFCTVAIKLSSLEYNNNSYLRISSILDNRATLLMEGYLKNKLAFNDRVSLDFDIILDDTTYIYSLAKRNRLYSLKSSSYVSYEGEDYIVSFGFKDSVASKEFYNSLFLIQDSHFGVKSLSRFEDRGDHYVLNNAYLDNDTAFSASYFKNLLEDTLYFGFTFTPSMNYVLRKNHSTEYTKEQSLFDGAIMYYDEYQSVGYSLRLGSRYYINISNLEEKATDLSLGGGIDYFGFTTRLNYLYGDNVFLKDTSSKTKDYYALEYSLYYKFYKIKTGVYYLRSKIGKVDNTNFTTDLYEYDLQYQFNENLILQSSVFYENLKLKNNTGLLFGLSIVF